MEARRIAILGAALALMAFGAPAGVGRASLASVSVKEPGFGPLEDARRRRARERNELGAEDGRTPGRTGVARVTIRSATSAAAARW